MDQISPSVQDKKFGICLTKSKAWALLRYELFEMLMSPEFHILSDIMKQQILLIGNLVVSMLECSLHICYYL